MVRYETLRIDHLGIVTGICREIGLILVVWPRCGWFRRWSTWLALILASSLLPLLPFCLIFGLVCFITFFYTYIQHPLGLR
jgi:hypothetical protein